MGTSTHIGPPNHDESAKDRSSDCQKDSIDLREITASQVAALFSLVLAAVWYFVELYLKLKAMHISNLQAEDILAIEFYWILLITAIYFIISEWATEESDGDALKCLKWGCAEIEFWLRVLLAVFLLIIATGLREFDRPFDFTLLHAQVLGLAVLYWGFLFWDLIVTLAGRDLNKWLLWGDFSGCLITLLLLWIHARSWVGEFLGFFLIFVMTLFSGKSVLNSIATYDLFGRIGSRSRRR